MLLCIIYHSVSFCLFYNGWIKFALSNPRKKVLYFSSDLWPMLSMNYTYFIQTNISTETLVHSIVKNLHCIVWWWCGCLMVCCWLMRMVLVRLGFAFVFSCVYCLWWMYERLWCLRMDSYTWDDDGCLTVVFGFVFPFAKFASETQLERIGAICHYELL